MPYVDQDTRRRVDQRWCPNTPGELTYAITRLVNEWLNLRKPEPDFERYSSAVGALECCKLEIYRRLIVPYEQKKCELNGDVFPCQT